MSKQLESFAHRRWLCKCGREHSTDIKRIVVEDGALSKLGNLISEQKNSCGRSLDQSIDRVLVVADKNTAEIGLAEVVAKLDESGFMHDVCILKCNSIDLVPDEIAVFNVFTELKPETALLIAVGSGTINDIVRFVSCKTNKPYFIVATAPSMDGYASTVTPLIHNNMKITYEACGAAAIVADSSWLADSPAVMMSAGLGDLLGKYSAICDWYLGHVVADEYWCPDVAELVLDTVNQTLARTDDIARRDPRAVKLIMDGLVMTGITMSYIGNSRPASGSEHHLSHFWEMRFLQEQRPAVLHGSKVGLAAILTSALYRHLFIARPDFDKAKARLKNKGEADYLKWTNQMKTSYGSGADEIIELESKVGKNNPEKAIERLVRLEKSWQSMKSFVDAHMPDHEIIRAALEKTGGAARPEDLSLSLDVVKEAVRHAKELRDRYSILQLYWDLDLVDAAEKIAEAVFAGKSSS
jgi:glycerol-1-phosphate dehydrogenase [NAD(P)+]